MVITIHGPETFRFGKFMQSGGGAPPKGCMNFPNLKVSGPCLVITFRSNLRANRQYFSLKNLRSATKNPSEIRFHHNCYP